MIKPHGVSIFKMKVRVEVKVKVKPSLEVFALTLETRFPFSPGFFLTCNYSDHTTDFDFSRTRENDGSKRCI